MHNTIHSFYQKVNQVSVSMLCKCLLLLLMFFYVYTISVWFASNKHVDVSFFRFRIPHAIAETKIFKISSQFISGENYIWPLAAERIQILLWRNMPKTALNEKMCQNNFAYQIRNECNKKYISVHMRQIWFTGQSFIPESIGYCSDKNKFLKSDKYTEIQIRGYSKFLFERNDKLFRKSVRESEE